MSTGNIVGTVAAAATLYVTGGNFGAASVAYSLGNAAGNVLDPPKGPTVEGPRLSDLSVQTSTYGQFIPRTYGTIGLSGNVFWLENNKIKEVVKKKKSGGKGGGSSSTVKTYTYFATFAVGLCEGPIAGVRRIWVGPDLVYDAGSDDLETIISSNNASAKFTIYTGTDTQQPDPRMQAEMGVANCPAFRGLAYIVAKDLLLTNYGNSVAGAQVKVEVVNSQTLGVNRISYTEHDYTETGFTPKASFISADTIRFHAPKWRNSYPSSSSAGVYNVSGSSFLRLPDISVTGITPENGVPPSGVSDDINDFFKGSKSLIPGIPDSDYFYAPSGAFSKQGKITAAITQGSGGRLYSYIDGVALLIAGSFSAVLVSGEEIYTANTSGIYKYSKELVLADSIPYSFPSMARGTCGIVDIGSGLVVISNNGSCYFSDYDLSAVSYVGSTGASIYTSASKSFFAINSVLVLAYASQSPKKLVVEYFNIYSPAYGEIPLSEIVESEAVKSSLIKPLDIDASGLADSVTGFKVTATGSIRNAIEPLRGAWPFDVVQAGYKIKATSRGSYSVVTIPIGELSIDTQLTESREMDSQLPQNVTVKYIDRDRDYDQNEQRAQRDNTEAVNSLVLELPVVLSATQSAQVADKLIRIYALEKSDFSFTLPAPYRYLEPGDVVTISADDADYVLRLVSVNQTADGRLECSGRPSSAATYTSIAPGDGGQQGAVTIPLAGATVGLIVDCPVIDEALQDAPGFAVGMNGYSAGWPGGILYRTADNGQTWDDLQALDGRATAGYAAGVLAASAGNLIQRGGSLTVSLIGGTLESVTEAQMLNGANIAAYGVNGRWEILRFQNATLNADGTYTLDTFWRGDKGTEWATGIHAANDIFVLMTDPDLAFVGMPTDSIGQLRDYRAVTAGADIDSAASQAFTYSAVNLETLSGVHPKGVRVAGDLAITWQRRTRVGSAWRDYVDASLGESAESYEVDIMDGATVKRTITATTPSVLYTSAMQVTDFGSPQASVTVNIYQLSAVVGKGYKLEATL